MNPDKNHLNKRTKIIILVVVLVIAAGLVGWLIGHSNNSTNNNQTSTSTGTASNSSAGGGNVKSLVSYTLPDGWSEGTCSSSSSTFYINPNGTSLDCSANPSAPIKIYVNSQNTTDCQQLKPTTTTGIKKHVCISLYIDGHKSLKASTEYAGGTSSYKTDTTISEYYVNTGNGVVAFEYTYTSVNGYQAGFDQLATSTKVKS